ncbi:hypothetical protein [Kutzneria albida]|uniref:Uncharacterized protein n=1 Tax=Kutzneria albida DSM 43870 TaxID=1449976 RepID=W5WHN8_9PSEU|nr:hypothetical protein [Kutzneria albida]AHI00383.1 hypothetical protein KALB_7025 [Kutzneria albida DSM 43870]
MAEGCGFGSGDRPGNRRLNAEAETHPLSKAISRGDRRTNGNRQPGTGNPGNQQPTNGNQQPELHGYLAARAGHSDGRTGFAVSAGDGQQREEIILDPASGQYIGERFAVTADWEGIPAGTTWSFTSVTTALTDQAG